MTDHQPLVAMFPPNKPTPAHAANRFSRWPPFFDNSTTPSRTARRRNTPMLMSSVDCQKVKIPFSTETKSPTTWTPFVPLKHWVCKWNQPTRVRYGKSLLEIQLWRRSCDSWEKVGQRKNTAMTQQTNSAKSPTHLVFVMAVYCMEPEWWFQPSYVVKCSILCTNAISASNGWSSWLGRPFTGRTSIPTFSIYVGNVRLTLGISPNRRKLPSTRGCYLRSRGAAYTLITPSTFWGITGLWLLMPISSGVTRCLSQGGKLSWKGPIGHRLGMQQLVPKNSYTLFHKNRKYLLGDGMSFYWHRRTRRGSGGGGRPPRSEKFQVKLRFQGKR